MNGSGSTNVATGLPVLDHLLTLLAEHASFDLALEVAPGGADEEIGDAGRALGQALQDSLDLTACRGHGSAVVPADEALAHVALEFSGRPLVVSNVDLSDMGVGGLATDIVARFLNELAQGAGAQRALGPPGRPPTTRGGRPGDFAAHAGTKIESLQ